MPTFQVKSFTYIAEDTLVEHIMRLDLPVGEYVKLPHVGAVEQVRLRRVWYEDHDVEQLEVDLYGRPLTQHGRPDLRKPVAGALLYIPVYPNEVEALIASFPVVMVGTCFNGRDNDGMQRRGQPVEFTRQEVASYVRAYGERMRERAGV
jgi:hypothetical protein